MEMKTLVIFGVMMAVCQGTRVRNIFWNTSTLAGWPGGYRTVVVNQDNPAWEYDQVNIICPVAREGEEQEQHIIYSVGQEEFRACRVTSPRPRIVAVCNKPSQAMYFTLTFRSFTPTPGALEFRPGHDYYFVSTSSRRDLHRRVGGYCTSHNMRMRVRVAQTQDNEIFTTSPPPKPGLSWNQVWRKKRLEQEQEQELEEQRSQHYSSSLQFQQTGGETYFQQRARPLRASSHTSSSPSTIYSSTISSLLVLLALAFL